ncbi:sugar kinase [Brachybacterium endophyticum]|uniref:Sugar kinase n=1 Tax=Brachybacterium endophyticum TaxID=2182385 RepID=A0A2U2RK13_9MICO|nr:FGGY family carbohydrate kinase [Brachybacterium endophyticum]PWH06200.1 sugar kinase [Brachybacterium endophyticum]
MSPSHPVVVLGFDVGTSGSKGVLVTPEGTVLRRAVREHVVSRPHPGHVEMDAEVWWREFVSISDELLAEGDVEVAAIGVSGMGPSVVAADAVGEPVRPAILYGVDSRASAQIRELEDALGVDEILSTSGLALSSQAAGPKIMWALQQPGPSAHRTRRFFMPSSFLAHRLTGEYVLDLPSASQTAPFYDPATASWDPERCERFAPGVEWPALRMPGDAAGEVTEDAARHLTGISPGTPVATGTIDAWAEAVSVGADDVGDCMVMYGTSMFLIATTRESARSRTLWASAGLREETHALTGGTATSGAITSWLRDLTGSADHTTLIAEAERSGPGANGLLMLPYFAGERSPIMDPDARGAILGLTLSHTRGDLYRAALEAAAFSVRHHLEEMAAAGVTPERVVAVGGGIQGGLWPQIVSDVTGVAQEIPEHTVGAAYGVARMAARLVGLSDTADWNPRDHVVTPDPAAEGTYEELYASFRELYPSTKDLVHALARRVED